MSKITSPAPSRVYLVGGGIASLAAAVFLIRDGDMQGHRITIFEQSDVLGGSLDGAGSPETGYVLRGGRMLESKYLCTFELFASIPALGGSGTVTDEIFAWNETMKTSSKSRLFRGGERVTAPRFGLSEGHILTIERLAIEPEGLLGRTSIADQFDAAFFQTDFWLMWCTTFAFQPWHSAVEFARYLVRFVHMVSGFDRLEGIMRTPFNQYDSMVRPLLKWLKERGVVFEMGTRVTQVGVVSEGGVYTVARLVHEKAGIEGVTDLDEGDRAIVTLGSMTEASTLGAMDMAPAMGTKADSGAWALWEALAPVSTKFGKPQVFDDHVDQSKWVSFTVTLNDPLLLNRIADLTGNVPGEGGLITFTRSNWLASIVVPYQPHFIGQPAGVSVFWGYGLHVDTPGNFVNKPMAACTGREILTEVLGHLGLEVEAPTMLEASIVIPCMMPFITAQFLQRERGDRPEIIPQGATNFAFIGQFCEQPDDVVFTVEYSVRSAQTAVYELLGIDRKPPPVYKGEFDVRVLLSAFLALHDLRAAA